MHILDDMSNDDIEVVLKQAIMGVEKGFFDSIGDKLLEKTLIEEEIAVSKVFNLYNMHAIA